MKKDQECPKASGGDSNSVDGDEAKIKLLKVKHGHMGKFRPICRKIIFYEDF